MFLKGLEWPSVLCYCGVLLLGKKKSETVVSLKVMVWLIKNSICKFDYMNIQILCSVFSYNRTILWNAINLCVLDGGQLSVGVQ